MAFSRYGIMKAREFIETVIRPLVLADGGDVEVVSEQATSVELRFSGAYAGCPGTPHIVSQLIEPSLAKACKGSIQVKILP